MMAETLGGPMMSQHSADLATDAMISTATLTIMLLTLILLAARLWYLISTFHERRSNRSALRDHIEP